MGGEFLPNEVAALKTVKAPKAGGEKNSGFVALMFRLAGLVQATNSRDLVYSFLGFQDLASPIIKPDYSLSLSQVYTDAARSFIQTTESLDVFGITSITAQPISLPSWAPDWTQRSPQGVPLYRPDVPSSFKACKTFAHKWISNMDDSRYLVVKGKVIDTVTLVSKHDFDPDNRNKGALDLFLRLGQQLDFFRAAPPPRVDSEDKPGEVGCATPIIGSPPSRRPFSDMLEGEAHQQKRLIKAILADNAYKFNPANEKQTGQVPISTSELDDYLAVYLQEAAIRQRSRFIPRLEHLTNVRNELRGNMLVSVKRRLFYGERARLGLAPQAVEVGDLVCILHGSRVPCILRRAGEANRHELIGQCYYEDWMYGDHVEWAEEEADSFELQ